MKSGMETKQLSPYFFYHLLGVESEGDNVQILAQALACIVLEISRSAASWYYYELLLNTVEVLCPMQQIV